MTALAPTVDRVRDGLAAYARLGATPAGGVTRLAYTPQERAAHDAFAAAVRDAGGRVEVDAAGNSVGVLRDGAPYVLLGSHLDSVTDGGRFDGAAGVVVAEAVAALATTDGPPLRIVAFAGEEGARFGAPCLGSSAATGLRPAGWTRELADEDGVTLAEAAAALGLDPEACEPWLASGDVLAFIEVHIEQGRVLETRGTVLGSVDAVAGSERLELTLTGRAEHSGATPMGLRADALAGAAELVLAVEALARRSPTLRATVGRLDVEPGGITTVPGAVRCGVDVRDVDPARQDAAVAAVRTAADGIAAARGLVLTTRRLAATDPVLLSAWPRLALQAAAAARGVRFCVMPSGAGHDAAVVARVAPAAMLFVPCAGGRSHVADESASADDLAVAAVVVADAVRALSQDPEGGPA